MPSLQLTSLSHISFLSLYTFTSHSYFPLYLYSYLSPLCLFSLSPIFFLSVLISLSIYQLTLSSLYSFLSTHLSLLTQTLFSLSLSLHTNLPLPTHRLSFTVSLCLSLPFSPRSSLNSCFFSLHSSFSLCALFSEILSCGTLTRLG